MSTRGESGSLGAGFVDRLLLALPATNEVAIVDLPGMKVLAEEAQPGTGDASQHTRLDEQVFEADQTLLLPWFYFA